MDIDFSSPRWGHAITDSFYLGDGTISMGVIYNGQISKGDMCVLIYKAMIAAAPKPATGEDGL